MSGFAFSPLALLNKRVKQLLLQQQDRKKLKVKCNSPQDSSQSSPPIYTNIAPKKPKSKAPTKEITNSLIVSSPLTKGCKNAKTTKAIARLMNPLPSSVATFFILLIKAIINYKLRCLHDSRNNNTFRPLWCINHTTCLLCI